MVLFGAFLVLLTPVAILGYLQRLVQRRAPTIKLTTSTSSATSHYKDNKDGNDDSLLALEPPQQQEQSTTSIIQLERNGLINPKERNTLKKAFRMEPGSESFWIATGKQVGTSTNDELEDLEEEPAVKAWYERISDYMIESQLAWSEQHGYVLSSRRGSSDCNCNDDDDLQGILCLVPPIYYDTAQNPTWQYQLQYKTTIRFAVGPSPTSSSSTRMNNHRDDGSHERLESFQRTTMEKHRTIMKDIPHWHIPLVGIVTESQGRGVGTQLFQQALRDVIGVDKSLPIYLECPNSKVSFFQRMGFECIETYKINDGGVLSSSSSSYQYNAMVRPGIFHIV